MISFLVFFAGMARDIRSKKLVPAKPWKKLISAEKMYACHLLKEEKVQGSVKCAFYDCLYTM